MDLALANKVVLITGASKGIGKQIAQGFYDEGCTIHIVSRSMKNLEAAALEIAGQEQSQIHLHAEDISSKSVAGKLLAVTGIPDILINNAGAIPGGNLQTIDEERWRKSWDLKVFGYINMCRIFFNAMSELGRGAIINVTGLAADRFDAEYVAGTTANAGLNAFTKAIGSRSLNHGVRVLAVSPGPVTTERLVNLMRAQALTEFGDADRWEIYFKNLPSGRAATVKEIADVVVFMASERASFMSGTIVNVDGGHGSNIPVFP